MHSRTWIAWVAFGLGPLPALAAEKCVLVLYATLPVTMSGTTPLILGKINGVDGRFVADSGAFYSMLTQEGAARFKLKLSQLPMGLRVSGIGGEERAWQGTAKDFTLDGFSGDTIVHNVDFMVAGNSFAGGADGVIGQNIIGFADTEFDMANGVIRLFHAKDCKDERVAYWHGDQAVGVIYIDRTTPISPHAVGKAQLNGATIRVMFDTGAYRSLLSLRAAKRAGFRRDDPATTAGGITFGIGKGTVETWIARFDLLDLGGEQIKNARLRVGDLDLDGEADMLLGADFFLSHRLYISHDQHRIYFTYNGGHVFDLRNDDDAQVAAQASVATATAAAAAGATAGTRSADSSAPPSAGQNEPTDAAGFRRRGAASAGRGDLRGALADLDEAVRRDATDPENFFQRGFVRLMIRQPVLAMDDIDQVLKLAPTHVQGLLLRGSIRLQSGAKESAAADFAAAVSNAPGDTGVGLRVAQIYSAHKDYADSIAQLDGWVKAHADDARLPSALNERCWDRVMTGQQLELALADCNLALKKGPRNSAVLDSRGMVYLRQGDLDHAIADYEAAIALQPKSPWSLYGLGVAESKRGLATSGQHLQAAVALRPGIAEEFKALGLAP